MRREASVIMMYAITSVHAGTGSSASYIDLPVQREVNTELPVIYASEVRGIFRSNFFDLTVGKTGNVEELKENVEKFVKVFGGGKDVEDFIKSFEGKLSKEEKEELKELKELAKPANSASSISFTDARLLFFPVRSLKGVIAWITSPYVLNRFVRDISAFSEKEYEDIRKNIANLVVKDDEVIVTENSDITFEDKGKTAVFEDFVLKVNDDLKIDDVINWIRNYMPDLVDFEFFKRHVAVVSDDVLRDLTRMGAEITPRIKINKETGTVDSGALWYEENVPAEAVLYSVVIGNLPEELERMKAVQIGGNASLARGIFNVKVLEVTEDENN